MNSEKVAFRDYLLSEKKYSLHTQKAYCDDLDVFDDFIRRSFLGLDLLRVEYVHVRGWVVFLVDSGLSKVSVNRKIASLKAFYKFMLKTKQIKSSPLIKHNALKVSRKIQIPFSEKEMIVPKFCGLEDFEEIRNGLMLEMFYVTGMRKSELIELRLEDVNCKERLIKVVGKRDKERLIPMLDSMVSLIELYLRERAKYEVVVLQDYFFVTSKGLKLSQSFVYRVINLYFSGVSEKVKKSPHVIRHTFATHLLDNGADLNSIKELLGHSSLASTQVYVNSSLAELKKVYNEAHPRCRK
ncbi:tyrosine-type recombinase/integrase [Flavobacterium sp. TSSA_36]|uniref:tyrosine-type recombinase/integrase n=1 Tax=Flavobacterium sp. TSSA_36 TaxID=3447669 RepID=UPI003F38D34E